MKFSGIAAMVSVVVLGMGVAEARSFIGVSTLSGPANTGYAVLSRMCEAKFPANRMCTTSEYLGSIHPAKTVRSHAPAWIQATPIAGINGTPADISGVPIGQAFNCAGWSGNAFQTTGLTVSGAGIFGGATCSETHQVACCK